MTITARDLRRHWFYLCLPFWLGASLRFGGGHDWAGAPRLGEAALLFDWCVFVPLLYLLCYRHLPARVLALRTVALVCGGVWLAGLVVPDTAQDLLGLARVLRWVGLAMLTVVEALALLAVLRVVFGAEPDPAELTRLGIPPLLVRAMLAEARFWRRVGRWLRGR